MRRHLLNILSIALPLFCLFLIYSWARSYLSKNSHIETYDGKICILFWHGVLPTGADQQIYDPAHEKFMSVPMLLANSDTTSESHFLGFGLTKGNFVANVAFQVVSIPIWFPLLLTAILAIVVIRARRRLNYRAKFGHCLSCGYDLRQSKEKCPECGTAIPTPAPA
jgi:hypothetical protein